MANTIRPKRSYTATNTPTLVSGELGINAADGKIFLGNAAGNANVLVGSLNRSDHTGTLGVASGGTGLTTLTANNVILGNGTSTPSFVAPGTSGNLLTSNGTTWQSTSPASSSSMPTGALMPYAGATAPTGYLLCDGSSVSSSTYLDLHAVISNTYGGSAYTGAGGVSFNLPDLKGRMPMGSMGTGSGLTTRVTGTKYGTESHTVSSSNISQFTTGNMNANVNHSHAPSGGSLFWVYNAAGANSVPNTAPQVFKIGADASTATTASTNLEHQHTVGSASPTAINHLPPTIGLNYIIKT
jgi:microcystin-dependent protein